MKMGPKKPIKKPAVKTERAMVKDSTGKMVCPECGKQLFFTKENGRYVGYCCGKWYRTRIEALRVIQDG